MSSTPGHSPSTELRATTKEGRIAVMRSFAQLGYLEDTGKRRPNRAGELEIVYRITARGCALSKAEFVNVLTRCLPES